MRTVSGLTDDTAISTGLPATMMSAAWPRITPPLTARPAPATPSCVNASRRVTRGFMRNRWTATLTGLWLLRKCVRWCGGARVRCYADTVAGQGV